MPAIDHDGRAGDMGSVARCSRDMILTGVDLPAPSSPSDATTYPSGASIAPKLLRMSIGSGS